MKQTDQPHFHPDLFTRGLVRILWIGKFSKVDENKGAVKVRIYWIQIESDRDHPKFDRCWPIDEATVRFVDLPIGYLTLLHTNAILHKGEIVNPWKSGKLPFEYSTNGSFTIDFSRKNLTVFNRRDLDEFGSEIIKTKTDRLKEHVEANTKCLGIKVGDDPYSIIIPCAELLRFFYCTSSSMANLLFDGSIFEPEKYLWDPSEGKSYGPIDGEVFLTLRKRMLDSDAKIIASLFADPEILRCYQLIGTEIAKADGVLRDAAIYPPFDRIVDLEFFYILIDEDGKRRIFITRIVRSHHKVNFNRLEFDREDSSVDQDEDPVLVEIPIPDGNDQFDDNSQTLTDGTFDDPRFAVTFTRSELGSRFPEIAQIPYSKIPPSKTGRGIERKYKRVLHPARYLTPASGKGGQNLRKVNIQPETDIAQSAQHTDQIARDIGAVALKKTVELLQLAAKNGYAKINYLENVLPHFTIISGIYFNVFAIKDSDYYNRQVFHLIDKENKLARIVLIVKAENDKRTRFLVDFQQRTENELSYQVFWFDGETVPSNANDSLKEALYCFASTKTANNKCSVNVKGLYWGSFKHIAGMDDKWLIEQIFSVKAKRVA